MRWLSKHKLSPIGLDLGAHSFKAVQLQSHAGGWDVAAQATLPRVSPGTPLTPTEIRRLQGVLDRRGFVGRDVVVAVPDRSLITAILELPARALGVPLAQIAEIEFGRLNKVDAGLLTTSMWELPASARASRATYMLAVGAKSDALDAYLDIVESGGLNVITVDEPISAGARGCGRNTTAGHGMTGVIDLGWHAATVAVLHGGTVVYTRKLSDGGLDHWYREANAAGFTDAEEIRHALCDVGFTTTPDADSTSAELLDLLGTHVTAVLKEVGQAFGYTGHQYPDAAMQHALLIGGGARIPHLPERCRAALGIDVRPAAFAGREPLAACMMSAFGLALGPGGAQ